MFGAYFRIMVGYHDPVLLHCFPTHLTYTRNLNLFLKTIVPQKSGDYTMKKEQQKLVRQEQALL